MKALGRIGVIAVIAVSLLTATFALAGRIRVRPSLPACRANERLALVAQSVPSASQVPCLRSLPVGWSVTSFTASDHGTRFTLLSDRASGRSVRIRLAATCELAGATPTTSRGEGVQTFIGLRTIDPRFSGTLYDRFQGGCVTYAFDFVRGPHIELMEEFESAVGLFSRAELRRGLRAQLHVDLDP